MQFPAGAKQTSFLIADSAVGKCFCCSQVPYSQRRAEYIFLEKEERRVVDILFRVSYIADQTRGDEWPAHR